MGLLEKTRGALLSSPRPPLLRPAHCLLDKTHSIAKGHALRDDKLRHVLAIERWLRAQLN